MEGDVPALSKRNRGGLGDRQVGNGWQSVYITRETCSKQRLCQEKFTPGNLALYNTPSVPTLFGPASCGATVLGWAYLEVLLSGYSC
jgi:hypothetical protein